MNTGLAAHRAITAHITPEPMSIGHHASMYVFYVFGKVEPEKGMSKRGPTFNTIYTADPPQAHRPCHNDTTTSSTSQAAPSPGRRRQTAASHHQAAPRTTPRKHRHMHPIQWPNKDSTHNPCVSTYRWPDKCKCLLSSKYKATTYTAIFAHAFRI